MGWALKRQAVYLMIIVVVLLIIFGKPIYNFFNREATCFDRKRNGTELGVDCGGGCTKVCSATAEAPISLWSRSFEVRKGVYNSIAMIENPNVGAGAKDVSYIFKLFDDKNILVYERKGKTNIPAQARFPIFEGSIFTGERVPRRTFFEFSKNIDWVKEENPRSDLKIKEQKTTNLDSSPRIEVEIENRGLNKIENVEIFAIIYDMVDNAISGSKSLIESIDSDETKLIIFTWPEVFGSPVGRVEIIPKFDTRE